MSNDNLRQHCKEVHWNVKLVKGLKTLTFNKTQEKLPKKKDKSDDGENLDSRWSVFQEESTNSVNTLNIESTSKNWAK